MCVFVCFSSHTSDFFTFFPFSAFLSLSLSSPTSPRLHNSLSQPSASCTSPHLTHCVMLLLPPQLFSPNFTHTSPNSKFILLPTMVERPRVSLYCPDLILLRSMKTAFTPIFHDSFQILCNTLQQQNSFLFSNFPSLSLIVHNCEKKEERDTIVVGDFL